MKKVDEVLLDDLYEYLAPAEIIETYPWLLKFRINAGMIGILAHLELVEHRFSRRMQKREIELHSFFHFLMRNYPNEGRFGHLHIRCRWGLERIKHGELSSHPDLLKAFPEILIMETRI